MKPFKLLYVYILQCSDGSYYTGVTNDPDNRVEEHNQGIDSKAYTYSRRPVKMVYCESFTDYNEAIDWETQVKKWSRKKKKALIEENYDKLKELAACKNKTSHKRRGEEG